MTSALRPVSPMVDTRLDPEIAPLVEALRMDDHVETTGSCCGHDREPAYVSLAVHGLAGLARFVSTLNRLQRLVGDEAFLNVQLDWDEKSATSCYFERFPDWIMLSFEIEGPHGPPSAKLLRRVADGYQEASGPPAAATTSAPVPTPSAKPKFGRNQPCACGSGLKFKRCCAGKATNYLARHAFTNHQRGIAAGCAELTAGVYRDRDERVQIVAAAGRPDADAGDADGHDETVRPPAQGWPRCQDRSMRRPLSSGKAAAVGVRQQDERSTPASRPIRRRRRRIRPTRRRPDPPTADPRRARRRCRRPLSRRTTSPGPRAPDRAARAARRAGRFARASAGGRR